MDPNSAGSQFFIVHEDSHFLDGKYTVFGRILTDESFQTLDRIAILDTVHSQTGQNNIPGGDVPNSPASATITNVEVLSRSELTELPNSDPPRMMHGAPMQTGGEKYTNMDLGVSFDTPQGLIIQTPT